MSDLTRIGVDALARLVRDGEVSAVDVVREHLRRVERLDPALHAFLRVNPAAEQEARSVDDTLRSGGAGRLAGIPVAVKDNLCTAGLATTCASKSLDGFVPSRDATAVQRLRSAGAVVLGKTNLDEFAMGSSTENSAFGPTRNPWDTSCVPGGSSGGSAAAVAAGLAPVALGSDTGGSVRQPAAFCGVVGLKPTYGRVSRSGLVAFGSSLDQVGCLARSVRDAALVLQVVSGADGMDSTCSDARVTDYPAACDEGVRGLRIGLPSEYFDTGLDPGIGGAADQAARALERAGAEIRTTSLPHTRFAIPAYYVIATAEASSNLARYDGVRYGRRVPAPAGLQSMYRETRTAGFGDEVKRRIMLGTFALSAGYHDRYYGRAQEVRSRLRRDFDQVFTHEADVLLTPATPTPPFRLGEKVADPLAMYLSDVYTVTANLAGIPGLVVPVSRTSTGLPIGVQLLAPHFAEGRLLAVGAVLEAAFPPFAAPDSFERQGEG